MLTRVMVILKELREAAFGPKYSFESDDGHRSSNLPKILFVSSIFFYAIYLALLQPNLSFSGEMWAEMATNYYSNSTHAEYWQRILATDAGYVPLPQRLIALFGTVFNLPASVIPYMYTWSAIFCTALLVGVFCLKPFRRLISSDILRFLVVLAIFIVADFETRSFINFTYFGAFFVSILTALAMVDDREDFPVWAWFVPLVVVSKPAVLAIMPMMIVVAVVSTQRFRRIVLVTLLVSAAQVLRMWISHSNGQFVAANEIALGDKVQSTFRYFLALIGRFLFGRELDLSINVFMLIGVLVIVLSLILLVKRRCRAMALVVIGLSLIFFNALLNSFVLSVDWNLRLERISAFSIHRHIIVGFIGSILLVSGLCEAMRWRAPSTSRSNAYAREISTLVFLGWFAVSGWFSYGTIISRDPGLPALNNSQWQKVASRLDEGDSPICVPIDPMGWVYGRECNKLNADLYWGVPLYFQDIQPDQLGFWSVDLEVPKNLNGSNVISFVIYGREKTQRLSVSAFAIITLKTGGTVVIPANQILDSKGTSIIFSGKSGVPIEDFSAIRISFDMPIQVAYLNDKSDGKVGVMWMGK